MTQKRQDAYNARITNRTATVRLFPHNLMGVLAVEIACICRKNGIIPVFYAPPLHAYGREFSMFTFFCTTCEAKLIVKDEKLVGKIVPCPQCGSMVLVQIPDDPPTPVVGTSNQPVVQKRFPNVLTHETASGIIGHISKEHLRAETFLETNSTDSPVSETEVKTRKILVGVLIGLSLFLLAALGFLIVFQKSESSEPNTIQVLPPEHVPVIDAPENLQLQPVAPELSETPVEDIEVASPPVKVSQENPPVVPEPIPHEEIQITNDTVSAFAEHMPGTVDASVPNIDIDAKLATPITELNFNQTRLIEFIRMLAQMTEIPMTLNIDEMHPRSLSAQTPVSGQFREVTAEKVLTETLATLGLQWVAVDRQILIFPTSTDDEADLTFDVADIVERTGDLTPEVLAEMVHKLVCPDANVSILPDNRLAVGHSEHSRKSRMRQRDDILRFLEQFRVVRQLPPQTDWKDEALAPEAFGWDRVMETMTLNHFRPVMLSRIVTQLEAATGLTIIIDHQSLHQAWTSFAAVYATVQCDRGTVNDVLELSLASVDMVALTYRILDHQTLEITTHESAWQPEKMVMEVHRYELQEDETPEDIVRTLRSAVSPETWHEGNIVVDVPSGCLFVRQSQPVQRQIRLFLSAPELVETEESQEP